MIFIVRGPGRMPPETVAVTVKLSRRTPSLVAGGADLIDHFCVGDIDAARAAGLPVVPVHDGWYADDAGGGVAVWGQGRYWEIRETPFTVKEAVGPGHGELTDATEPGEPVNVRGAIFGV